MFWLFIYPWQVERLEGKKGEEKLQREEREIFDGILSELDNVIGENIFKLETEQERLKHLLVVARETNDKLCQAKIELGDISESLVEAVCKMEEDVLRRDVKYWKDKSVMEEVPDVTISDPVPQDQSRMEDQVNDCLENKTQELNNLRKSVSCARKLMNDLHVPAVIHGRELELSAELSEAEYFWEKERKEMEDE